MNARAAAPLAAVSVPEIYHRLDDVDAETFLQDINFPDAARHLAFEVFSRSFFAEPAKLSAAELAAMFHIYFLGSSEGLVFDVAECELRHLPVGAVARVPISIGCPVPHRSCRSPRSRRTPRKHFACTTIPAHHFDADAVVLATDVAGLQRIVDASPRSRRAGWRAAVRGMRTAPPFVVQRLWLDRPVAPDRPPFLGTGGLEPLDNVSVLDRYERQAVDWARRTGGSVVELHSYAVRDASRRRWPTGCVPGFTSSTPRPAMRASSPSGSCAATTARGSRRATIARRPGRRRIPA